MFQNKEILEDSLNGIPNNDRLILRNGKAVVSPKCHLLCSLPNGESDTLSDDAVTFEISSRNADYGNGYIGQIVAVYWK